MTEVRGKPSEIQYMVLKMLGNSDAVAIRLVLSVLERAKKPCGARDCVRCEAQFSEDALPLLVADSTRGTEVFEDFSEVVLAVCRNLEGLSQGI